MESKCRRRGLGIGDCTGARQAGNALPRLYRRRSAFPVPLAALRSRIGAVIWTEGIAAQDICVRANIPSRNTTGRRPPCGRRYRGVVRRRRVHIAVPSARMGSRRRPEMRTRSRTLGGLRSPPPRDGFSPWHRSVFQHSPATSRRQTAAGNANPPARICVGVLLHFCDGLSVGDLVAGAHNTRFLRLFANLIPKPATITAASCTPCDG